MEKKMTISKLLQIDKYIATYMVGFAGNYKDADHFESLVGIVSRYIGTMFIMEEKLNQGGKLDVILYNPVSIDHVRFTYSSNRWTKIEEMTQLTLTNEPCFNNIYNKMKYNVDSRYPLYFIVNFKPELVI